MYAPALLSAVVLLFSGLVSASPVEKRQASAGYLRTGYIQNDYLGGVWTKMTASDSAPGVPIGVSPIASSGLTRTQLFNMYYNTDAYGDTTYLFTDVDTGGWLTMEQITSSDNYAPGYAMLQTASTQADATYFTITPGLDDGSWYILPSDQSADRLDWYRYDDPSASFIPVINNAPYDESSQSWTFHTA